MIIKEARAHTVIDRRGADAIKRLRKEYEILSLIEDTGISPRPIELFQAWENYFLVEEYIDGADLREFILTQTPFLRVNPLLEESRAYYDTFQNIVRSFLQALDLLHSRGLIFGDLSPNNIKIDPITYGVRIIDFEAATRVGVDTPTFLYTPGFRSTASIREAGQTVADDYYAMAAIALYVLFPIAAVAELRSDIFDTILNTFVHDMGWEDTEVSNVIYSLSRNEIACSCACDKLSRPARLRQPVYSEVADADQCEPIIEDLGRFILENMRVSREDSLFPADPFVYSTNPLSLGFGACGILYSLKKCGFEIPRPAYDWLEKQMDKVSPGDLAPGILTGGAGIAWALAEIGFEDRAVEFMNVANNSPLLQRHHSHLYGMAGVGMANLYMYSRTLSRRYLDVATELAEHVIGTAQQNKRGMFWEADNLVHVGFGYGQTGVALFLLRLHQLTKNEIFLESAASALNHDLSYGIVPETGVLTFPHTTDEPTALPYLEEGTAGIAKTAMRFGRWEQMDMMLSDVFRKYSSFPSLLFGLSGFVDTLTDAFLFSGEKRYLHMAKRPLSGIRQLYLLKQPNGVATPGDNLFRISCDYATGVAGVMRALYRYAKLDQADFVLDEIMSSDRNDPAHAGEQAYASA